MSYESLTKNFANFIHAADELKEAEKKAMQLSKEINARILVMKEGDKVLIEAYEKELHDTPREELRRVLDRLKNADPVKDSAYWMNYYRGNTGALNDQQKAALKERADILTAQVALTQPTEKEAELASLRNRAYSATPTEKEMINDVLRNMSCKWSAVRAARDQLSETFLEHKDYLEQIYEAIDGKASAKRNYDYNAANDALKALL